MIVFDLGCSRGHRFEAWFRDGSSFDQQRSDREIACPMCGDREIAKAPMAPHVATTVRHADASHEKKDRRIEVRKFLERVRQHVETTCDYVGASFPEEARRIHYGESDARGIYGEADHKEAKELRDEGIDVHPIPWLPKRSS
ncbi:MAG: DUF1178 family protein [Rhodospirillales bacterium]|nr:DUF1178 family protein [Rhodospirillales bacterium]